MADGENRVGHRVDHVAPPVAVEVARAVAFLCREDGGWGIGQVLQLGGGAAL